MIVKTIFGPTTNNKQNLRKLLIRCDNCGSERIIPARYEQNPRRTQFCRDCANHIIGRPHKRNGLQYYMELLGEGYELMYFLDTPYTETPLASTKAMFLCPVGHFWLTPLDPIKAKGCRCPYCSGRAPKTEVDYYNLAHKKGIKFIGPLPKGVIHKTLWECSCGSRFETAYNSIYNEDIVRCENCLVQLISNNEYAQLNSRNINHQLRWSNVVYQDYNFKCEKCGTSSTKKNSIQAHHIFNWKDFPLLRYSTANGVTLCKNHHYEFHRLFGNRYNNLQQLETFLGHSLPLDKRTKLLQLIKKLLISDTGTETQTFLPYL